jgi:two-component system response regulator AlgR
VKLLIVDDEPLARLRLRTLIDRLPAPPVHAVAEAGDVQQALACVAQDVPDVVLLDIRMPGATAHEGLSLARRLQSLRPPPAVIFVTAHAEHALKAFELQALDYLTKPVRLERLQAALSRVRPPASSGAQVAPADAAAPAASVAGPEPVLVIHERGRVLRFPLHELLYLRAEQKLVLLRTSQGCHYIDESLADMETRLQQLGARFIRVHRNALVALQAIRALELREMPLEPASEHEAEAQPGASTESWAVRVAPVDEWLAVSRRQAATVRAALGAAPVAAPGAAPGAAPVAAPVAAPGAMRPAPERLD